MAKEIKKAASLKVRTISAEVMTDVATFLPNDGFKLSEGILGKDFTVVDVIDTEFAGRKSFTVVLQNEDTILNMSASLLKKARVLSTTNIKLDESKYFDKKINVVVRSKADELWAGSRYFHSEAKMKANDDFLLPETIRFEYAVIREDAATGKVAVNPFLYEGFRKVVESYRTKDSYPTMEDFKAELKKEGTDRIDGLPKSSEPTLFSYVKENDLATLGFTLILKDTLEKTE